MIDLIWLVVIFAIALALGRAVLGWLQLAPPDAPRQWVYGSALGLGLLGYGVFALSILHWLSFAAVLGLLGLGAVITLPMLIQSAREIARAPRSIRFDQIPPIAWIGVLLFGLHFAINLVSCFNPPIDLDSLGYHLTAPKLNILHNDLVFRAGIAPTFWPLHQEMLFQLGLLVGDDGLAHLISFLVAALAVSALWVCAQPHFAPGIVALAAFIFYTIPVIGYEASIAYVDVGVALFALLAWFALTEWHTTRADRWLWLSALMAGFAPATKLSGAFIPALLIGGVCLFAPKEKNRWRSCIGYGVVAGMIVAPWLIRNFLRTGNPVAPYFFDLLGARGWTAHAAYGTTTFTPFGLGRDAIAALMLPWNITMFSTAFGGGNVGPIFLAVLPLLFFTRPFPALIKSALGMLAGYLAIWFWVAQEIRFLIPILPMLSLVAAFALITWVRQNDWMRRVAIGVVLLTGFANLILLGSNFARPPGSVPPTKSWRVLFGLESRLDYLRRVLPSQKMVEAINRLPVPGLVLTLGLSDVYYLDRDFIRGFPVEQPLFDPTTLPNADAIAARVRALGVTHVVLNRNSVNGITVLAHPTAPSNFAANMETFIWRDLTLLAQIDGYDLYVVRR